MRSAKILVANSRIYGQMIDYIKKQRFNIVISMGSWDALSWFEPIQLYKIIRSFRCTRYVGSPTSTIESSSESIDLWMLELHYILIQMAWRPDDVIILLVLSGLWTDSNLNWCRPLIVLNLDLTWSWLFLLVLFPSNQITLHARCWPIATDSTKRSSKRLELR